MKNEKAWADFIHHYGDPIINALRDLFDHNNNGTVYSRGDNVYLGKEYFQDGRSLDEALKGFKSKSEVIIFVRALIADFQVDYLQLRPTCLIFDRYYRYIYINFNPQNHCIIQDYVAMFLSPHFDTNYQDGNLFIYESRKPA